MNKPIEFRISFQWIRGWQYPSSEIWWWYSVPSFSPLYCSMNWWGHSWTYSSIFLSLPNLPSSSLFQSSVHVKENILKIGHMEVWLTSRARGLFWSVPYAVFRVNENPRANRCEELFPFDPVMYYFMRTHVIMCILPTLLRRLNFKRNKIMCTMYIVMSVLSKLHFTNKAYLVS